jgi:hypothetical protein
MGAPRLTRRRALQMAAVAAGGLAAPALRRAVAEAGTPNGKMVLAWHTNIAARWLDPQQHDGTATPDNFLNALHDGLRWNNASALPKHFSNGRISSKCLQISGQLLQRQANLQRSIATTTATRRSAHHSKRRGYSYPLASLSALGDGQHLV